MTDDRMNLEIGLDVKVTDLDQAKALREEFERLNKEILQFSREIKASVNPLSSLGRARTQLTATAPRGGNAALDAERQTYAELKRRFAFERRMAAQKRSEESTAAKKVREEQAETRRALNDQLNFSMRMVRERARAEADSERATRREIAETAKARDRANRKAVSEARELERIHARAAERAARGAGQVRSGVGRVAGTAAATGAVVGYGTERVIERGISSRMEADTEETKLKIFADTDDGQGGRRAITDADIRKLRRGSDGLDNLAVRTGTSVPEALRAYTEAAKAGLLEPARQARNILTATNGLELDPTRTTKLLGTLARNMGAAGTPDRLYRTLNAVAVGSREDPTQSNEIVEGLNRSQGLLAMSRGFTPEDLVAMVSGGQSVGIQPGKAGTAITALGSSILQGGNKFLDPKKRKELNFAARNLGFASAKDLANQFAGENGKAVYYKIMKGLQGMAPQLRQQVADALSGGQWSDEDLQIVNGIDGQIATDREIHDPKNAGFLDEANAKKMQSWQGLWNQSKTIFSLFWESFGAGFDGILRDINAFVLDLHGNINYDSISGYVREGLDGLKAGLGFETYKEALASLVPGNIGNIGKSIGAFAKGFSSALREIGGAVSSVARMFGGSGGAESIGRLSAQLLSLGMAAVFLSPLLGVLGGVTSIVLGIANAARAAAGVLGLGAGAAAGGGAVAGAMAGVARLLSGGFVLGLAGAIGAQRGEISTLVLNAVRPLISAIWSGLREAFSIEGLKAGGRAILDEMIPAPLKRWLESGTPDQGKADGSRWSDPPMRKSVEQLRDSLDQNVDALNEGARVQRQSLKATEDLKGLIHKTSLNGTAGAIGDSIRDGAARAASPLSGSVGGGSGGGGGGGDSASSGSGGGSATAPSGSAAQNFNAKAPGIMERLQKDLNLTKEQAAGILGNLGHESDGFRAYGENGGKGPGVGWAQWTDPGRKARFLDYAQRNGLNPRSDEASYGFLKWELANTHAKALANLRRQTTVEGATRQFEADYEGAGVKHMDRRLGYAQQAFNMGGGSGSGSSTGPGGNPADVAAGYLGKGEYNDRPTIERFVGHNIRGSANAWCARFVNASLAAVGQTGTGSAIANSYLRWGKAISAEMVQKGDVLVEHRGRGVDGQGGHVGFSTGRTRRGRNGELELEMLGGNTNDQVATSWEKASRLAIRRSTQVSDQLAAGQARTQELANGAKPALGGPEGAANVGQSAPVSANAPLSNRSAPAAGGGAQGGGGGPQVNAPITINGHNKSPSELAAEVQRHLQDSMNRRTHDYDGFA